MIVVDRPGSVWRIVYQPDHAATSGAIASRWRRPEALPASVWPRLLTAIRRHDDGWQAAEQEPALDERGRPFGFKHLPTPQHLSIWRRGMRLVADDDAYAGLVVALHARWLYTHIAEVSAEHQAAAQTFIEELDQRVDRLIERLSRESPAMREAVTPQRLTMARRLLGVTDGWSLMLAGALPVGALDEPVAFGDASAVLAVSPTERGLRISPWPFEGGPFEVEMVSREVPQQFFDDPSDAAEVLERTSPTLLRFEISAG